jgi:hypothetical protein
MPYITFMWNPKSDNDQVAPLVDPLRAVANAHDVGFFVEARDTTVEKEPTVIVNEKVTIPPAVVEHLQRLAKQADVVIYVNLPTP